jgi:hypothetical protein
MAGSNSKRRAAVAASRRKAPDLKAGASRNARLRILRWPEAMG